MSKRQHIRRATIIIMFFFFPITITWLSPFLPLMHAGFFESISETATTPAYVRGVLTGAGILFLLQFLISLFLGRVFCGFACSGGGLQECLMRASEKNIKNRKIGIIKYFIWVPWLAAIISGFIWAGGINRVDFFIGTVDNYNFLFASYRYMIFFSVIFLITILHLLVGKRAFCYSVCWMSPFMIIGTKISQKLRLPRLHLQADKENCNGCSICSHKCIMSIDVKEMVMNENMADAECILCGECVDACPKKVIKYSFGR